MYITREQGDMKEDNIFMRKALALLVVFYSV